MAPMAPSTEDQIDEGLKAVIQDLYEIQVCINSYQGSQTRDVLIQKAQDLATSLSSLSHIAPQLQTLIPPEIIAYVEDGRNPDIYTREFVESVQKFNMELKGKCEAFGAFRDMLGQELVMGGFASQREVDEVVGMPLMEKELDGEDVKMG